MGISRRRLLMAGGLSFFVGAIPSRAAPRLGMDGLYEEPWLNRSSGDLQSDFAEAVKAKKTFAIVWELRGCPWCKRMHLENFARADIATYLSENFYMIQLNIQGQREIKDLKGEILTEEALSYSSGINSTPTMQFFRPSDASKPREAGRIAYVEPDKFLLVLRYAREGGYDSGTFEDWVRTHRNPSQP